MPDAGQRIVLRENRDPRLARPTVARNAVGISQMPRSTANPFASRKSASVSADWCSSNAISGFAWMSQRKLDQLLAPQVDIAVARFFNDSRSDIWLPAVF